MIKIFNTISKKKEPLLKNKKIFFYVCGITSYEFCHIGHARTFIFFDVVIRYLRYLGYKVCYVRNITNIDDKIINFVNINNLNINNYTNDMINEMKKDFYSLNILEPNHEPITTDYIKNILSAIKFLLIKNYAYISVTGDVVFSLINNKKHYGSLSKRFINIKKKKKYLIDKDFVIWKKNNNKCNFFWNSFLGNGRPGWHIQCSVISNSFLIKNCIYIHGGGIDLLFPHHENEIIQSIYIYGKNSCPNLWMHTEMVIYNNKKMSKSNNNFLTIKDILSKYNFNILRLYLLSTHYRKKIFFSYFNLNKFYLSVKKIFLFIDSINFNNKNNFFFNKNNIYEKKFIEAMNDDFNIPKVCFLIFKLYKKILYIKKKKFNSLYKKTLFILYKIFNMLGLIKKKNNFFIKKKHISKKNIYLIKNIIIKRNIARKNKKWKIADKLRKYLYLKYKIILEDNKNGITKWKLEN